VPGLRILDTPKSATFIRVSDALDASRMFSGCNRLVDSTNSVHADPVLLGRDVMTHGSQFSAF